MAPEKLVIEKQIENVKDDSDQTKMNFSQCTDKIQPLPSKAIDQPVIKMTDKIKMNPALGQPIKKSLKRKQRNVFSLQKLKKK